MMIVPLKENRTMISKYSTEMLPLTIPSWWVLAPVLVLTSCSNCLVYLCFSHPPVITLDWHSQCMIYRYSSQSRPNSKTSGPKESAPYRIIIWKRLTSLWSRYLGLCRYTIPTASNPEFRILSSRNSVHVAHDILTRTYNLYFPYTWF